jgi:perosamine synthetase
VIPVCEPFLKGNEKKYIMDCFRTNWISSSGKYIDEFESAFSRYCGAKYGIAVTNGTTALHLALAALGIGSGDEVIMPVFTIASTAFAVIYCGGRPVFVDSEPDTWNIDAKKIEEKITKKTKAIMPVHIYGHPCDMSKIMKIAKKYNLFVIEDAAEAHGAVREGRKVGGIGDTGCFSFYGNKIITCGEGGMVVTNSKKIANACRRLKNLAFLRSKRFLHREIGFNYRMTNLQAALGLAQFEKIESLIEKRRKNAALYNKLLSGIQGITLPVEKPEVRNVYWVYSILAGKRFGVKCSRLISELKKKGIDTRTFFVPMHQQPILKKMGLASNDSYPVAEKAAGEGLYLPSSGGLKKSQIEFICEAIKKIKKRG